MIVSASMGGGHDGAARELAARLERHGVESTVVDFLHAFPRPLAHVWRWIYITQLRRFPESYERSYQLFYRHPRLWGPFVRFQRSLAGRRTMRWIRRHRPDVIVSTYSFASLVLGRLKEEGKTAVPVVNFMPDFGVHPRVVHPALDLNLAIHPVAAASAQRFVSVPTIATGPAVPERFRHVPHERAHRRATLGLGDDDRMVLVVAGSWGVGHGIDHTLQALVDAGDLHVVAVCGNDEELRARLERRGLGTVIGWTDDMAGLIGASDVVVENAGGLTSLEAFTAGVPIVSHRPIPGHGRDNVRGMVEAGVTTAPCDDVELVAVVRELAHDGPRRAAQVAAASAMFVEDPAVRIAALAAGDRERALSVHVDA